MLNLFLIGGRTIYEIYFILFSILNLNEFVTVAFFLYQNVVFQHFLFAVRANFKKFIKIVKLYCNLIIIIL